MSRISVDEARELWLSADDEELKRLQQEFRRICETRGIGNGATVEALECETEEREAERQEAAQK